MMRFEFAFLILAAFAAVVYSAKELDCKLAMTVRCSTQCDPLCAGNDTRKETFINPCLYMVEACNRGLKEYNYAVIDENNACPINCDIMRNCASVEDPVCVKNHDQSFNKTFTNECQFLTAYCNDFQTTLGLDYCIYRQRC